MVPKFRAWSKLASRMYIVNGLHFDRGMVQYANNDNAIRFIKLENIILMQSTGLKDKNDKEIFEGDILTDGHTTGDIRNHPTLGFYTVDESSKEGYLSDTVGIEDFEEAKEFMRNSIEVIGNIYENPELLEEE